MRTVVRGRKTKSTLTGHIMRKAGRIHTGKKARPIGPQQTPTGGQGRQERTATQMKIKTCNCGSGKPRVAVYDARNIFVTYVCDDCRQRKLSPYRPEIFTDSNYWTEEPIEPEE